MISTIIRWLLGIYSLVLLVYVVIKLIRIPANKWTELLGSIVDPVLDVTRSLMARFVPALTKGGFDWSPVVLLVVLQILRILI